MEIEIEFGISRGWGLPWFRFRVKFKKLKWDVKAGDLKFREVEGLDFEDEQLEYREGLDNEYSKITQPGMVKYTDVVLKRGKFKDGAASRRKLNEIINNSIRDVKDDITIEILDEEENAIYEWYLPDTKIKYISVLQPDESEELYIKKLWLLFDKDKMTEKELKRSRGRR